MLLPDERRELQVTFRSPQAGIFTEDWQVDTWPRVPTGTLQLSFCGIAVSRDTHAGDRAELQSGLEQQAMAQALRQLVLDVADSASLQGMAAVPRVPSMLTDADRFLLLNTSIAAYYNQRIVCSLADLHARAFCALHAPEKSSAPPSAAKKKPAPTPVGKKGAPAAEDPRPESAVVVPEWDQSIAGLRNLILQLEDDAAEPLLAELQAHVVQLSVRPPPLPRPDLSEVARSVIVSLLSTVGGVCAQAQLDAGIPLAPFCIKDPPPAPLPRTDSKADSKKGARKKAPAAAAATPKPPPTPKSASSASAALAPEWTPAQQQAFRLKAHVLVRRRNEEEEEEEKRI